MDKLVKAIAQTNPVKREKAIKALCDFCMANPNMSQEAMPTLNQLLMDPDIKISSYTAQTIVRIGKTNVALLVPSVNFLMGFLNFAYNQGVNYKGSWTTVADLVEELGDIGAYSPEAGIPAIPIVYKPLNPPIYHPHDFIIGMERVYAASAHALGLFANKSSNYVKEASPTLFRCMVDTFTYPRLIEDSRNRSGFRWWIIYALLELGKSNPAHVMPVLVKGLTHPNFEVRKKVIEILDTIASDPRTAVPPLVQCINSLDPELSKNASLTLSSLGQTTPEFVVPSLISLLQSSNPVILKNTLTVVYSCARVNPDPILDVKQYVLPALNNGDNEVRLMAVKIMGILAQKNPQYAQEAIPYLIYITMNDVSQAVKDESVALLNFMKVDIKTYTTTIEMLRQDQELITALQKEKKDTTEVVAMVQRSKDALIELKFNQAQEFSAQAYNKASGMLSEKQVKEATKKDAPADSVAKEIDAQKEQETLLKQYTFESFIKGPSNSFALAAARAVAENPSQAYNPLFVYSGPGLGKTHLLNAIGNYFKERKPLSSVLYLTSEKFTNELISAIQSNALESFRERYRNVDILLIDDIQSIAGKERTQEEFFNTFNTLFTHKKQIILSSDRPPSSIPTLEERLRSRFEWGLITEIGSPAFETRIAILKSKAAIKGTPVPEEVYELIANKVTTNIRELEGALNAVVGYAQLNMKEINPALAREVLKIEDKPAAPPPNLELEWGTTYISKEQTSDTAFDFFKAVVEKGAAGMCISRIHPDKLNKRYKFEKAQLFWLSKTACAESMSPTNISKMAHNLNQFIKNNKNCIILIDGLEYLISNNDFNLVMRFLDDINENIVVGKSVLVLPITMSTYSAKELTLLERNTVELKTQMIPYVGMLFAGQEEKPKEASKEDLITIQRQQEEILTLITNDQERLQTAQSLGLKIDEFESGLKEIRELSNNKDYAKAISMAKELKEKINSKIEGSMDKVSDIIENAKTTLKKAEELGVKTEEMDSMLNQAIGAFRLNMYEEALEYANKMLQKAEEPIKYRVTVNLLKEAKDKINEVRGKGLDSNDAENYLKDAKPAILSKDYDTAQDLAKKSIAVCNKVLSGEKKGTPKAAEPALDAPGKDKFQDIMGRINIAKQKMAQPKKAEPAPEVKPAQSVISTHPPVREGKNPVCPACSKKLLIGSKFCNRCGNKL